MHTFCLFKPVVARRATCPPCYRCNGTDVVEYASLGCTRYGPRSWPHCVCCSQLLGLRSVAGGYIYLYIVCDSRLIFLPFYSITYTVFLSHALLCSSWLHDGCNRIVLPLATLCAVHLGKSLGGRTVSNTACLTTWTLLTVLVPTFQQQACWPARLLRLFRILLGKVCCGSLVCSITCVDVALCTIC